MGRSIFVKAANHLVLKKHKTECNGNWNLPRMPFEKWMAMVGISSLNLFLTLPPRGTPCLFSGKIWRRMLSNTLMTQKCVVFKLHWRSIKWGNHKLLTAAPINLLFKNVILVVWKLFPVYRQKKREEKMRKDYLSFLQSSRSVSLNVEILRWNFLEY